LSDFKPHVFEKLDKIYQDLQHVNEWRYPSPFGADLHKQLSEEAHKRAYVINTLEKFEECNIVSRSAVRDTYSYFVRHDEQSQALEGIEMSWIFRDLTSASVDYELGCFVTIFDTYVTLRLGFLSIDEETFVGLKQVIWHSDFIIRVGLFEQNYLTGFGVAYKVQKSTMADQGSLKML
jgi:hypothetical protein